MRYFVEWGAKYKFNEYRCEWKAAGLPIVSRLQDKKRSWTDNGINMILDLARHAAKTGEPIARAMEYCFPGCGFESVVDQFMLGDEVLVAPVLTKETYEREIRFPAGKWQGDDGSIVEGPCTQTIDVPLTRLPYYKKIG